MEFLSSNHILNKFIEEDKLSAYRLYIYIKTKYNNHLHSDNFKEIQTDLNISKQVIYKNLRQLIEMGACQKYSDSYWRINSWKKWCPSNKNRITALNLTQLKDLKFIRTLHYLIKYKSAYYCAKKNVARDRKKSSKFIKKQKSSGGFYPVAANFVKQCTGVEVSENTLLKHLKRSELYSMTDVIRHFSSYFSSPFLSEVLKVQKYCQFPKHHIKKSLGSFHYLSFDPNQVRFFF